MRLLLASVLAFVGVLTPAFAQRASDPLVPADPAAVHLDRLCVKLREGCGAELVDGRLQSRSGADLSAVARWFRLVRAEPLVSSVPWAELDRWHAQATAVLPEGRRPGHLGLWFRLHTATAEQAAALRESLASEPLVRCVYHEPRYFPASLPASFPASFPATAPAVPPVAPPGTDPPPTTPPFMAMQLSHQPNPVGHDFRAAAGIYGGRGQGIGLRMIEDTWIFDHEDVTQLVATNLIGPMPPYEVGQANHGLSGASLVLAGRNAFGITGTAERMSARFLPIATNGGIENSLALAVSSSQPGDVVMIVIMVLIPGFGPGTFVPLEFFQAAFDAVLTATANGRHVVIPAGNGNRSLDDPALLGRFDRSFRDSGAIIVGASAGGSLQKATFSNWGSRIDAHSWGGGLVSCGYGTLFQGTANFTQAYTDVATGTSSATPHLAGAIAAIQGASKRQLGQTLSNAQIVALLATHGVSTPDVIGRRTDLAAVYASLGILDGLQVAAPDVSIGNTPADVITAQMVGEPGDFMVLFGGFTAGDTNLGFNRPVHIDLAGLLSLGAFVLPTASWQTVVPNDLTLRGTDLYLQAVRWRSGALHVTNSCQVTLL